LSISKGIKLSKETVGKAVSTSIPAVRIVLIFNFRLPSPSVPYLLVYSQCVFLVPCFALLPDVFAVQEPFAVQLWRGENVQNEKDWSEIKETGGGGGK